MPLQTHFCQEFFPTEKATATPLSDAEEWKVKPIKRRPTKENISIDSTSNDNHDFLLDDKTTKATNACMDCETLTSGGERNLNHIKKVHEPIVDIVTNACTNRGKRTRRGRKNPRHTNKDHDGKLNIFSTNAAGLVNGKMESLRSEVLNMKSNLITVQETHFRKKGKFKIPNFIIFESIRAKKRWWHAYSCTQRSKPQTH